MSDLLRDLTLEEGDQCEYWDDYQNKWKPGTIVIVDTNDTDYPYQIRDSTGDDFWGHSAHGVRRPLDQEQVEESRIVEVQNPVDPIAPVADMVNEPPHYNSHPKGIECIDVIEDNPFLTLGNAMKYLWRVSWGGKGNDIEDLKKAVWYIEREIARRNG